MELYYHRTDGGAEYYGTTYRVAPNGEKVSDCKHHVLRTDGDELEVLSMEAIKAAGFKSVKLSIITDNERADILNALHDKRQSYVGASGNEFAQQRMAEIDRLIEKLQEIL
jgi:hypothetical protein